MHLIPDPHGTLLEVINALGQLDHAPITHGVAFGLLRHPLALLAH
jgi:hypothetical protein